MNYNEFRKRYQWNAKTDKLGQGGFAKVYRAIDTLRDRPVVLKIADVPSDHKFSLQREVELNRDLTPHLNIVQFRNCYRLEDEHGEERDYATMDYFPGGSLTNVMMAQAIGPDNLRDIVTGMLRGLAHLEQEKVIHRDFKPGNVLMARDDAGRWIPKIADFGLSRFTSTELTVSNSSVGITYDYAAPEQFRPGPVNRQADLWAFGVIVYRLCTSRLPFTVSPDLTGESMRIELARIINQAQLPADLDRIVEPYQTIIRRCLVRNLDERVKSAEELLALLNKPVTQPEPTVIEQVYTETLIRAEVPPTQPISQDHLPPSVGEIANRATPAAAGKTASTHPSVRKKNRYLLPVLLVLFLFLLGSYSVWHKQKTAQTGKPISVSSDSSLVESVALATRPNVPATEPGAAQHTPPVNTLSTLANPPADPAQKRTEGKVSAYSPVTLSESKTQTAETVSQPEETRPTVESKPEVSAELTLRPETADSPPTKPERSETRPSATNRTLRLPGSTEVVVALTEPVAAATAGEGQRVSLQVVRPITLDGEVVIAQGAEVVGEVTNVNTGGKKDVLEIRIRSVRGAGGQTVEVRSATFRYVGDRNVPLVFKAGQQFIVYTSGAHKFSF